VIEPNPGLRHLNRTAEAMSGRERFVRLDRNERVQPFSTAEFADMLSALRPEMLCAYPDPSPLVDRLSAQLGVPADWICPTNGSDAAIRKIFQSFLREGDCVLLADPTYAMYPIYAQMFGAHADLVSYGPDRALDVEVFEAALTRSPRIAALACPDQPTGAVLSLAQLRRLVGCGRQHNVLCVVDEAYYPFHQATAVPLIREFENLIVTRSFSKAGGLAGLRLGYLVARPEIGDSVDRVRGAHEVNAVAIRLGSHVLDHPEISEAYVRVVEAGRVVLKRAAAGLGFRTPESPANFQLLELPDGLEPARLVSSLAERGYLVKGGFTHPSVARCIRVTLAGPDVMEPFATALREVCARADV
jgi:histidinol-phosphate aminotransferase